MYGSTRKMGWGRVVGDRGKGRGGEGKGRGRGKVCANYR